MVRNGRSVSIAHMIRVLSRLKSLLAVVTWGVAVLSFPTALVHAGNGDVENGSFELNRHGIAFRFAERQDLPHGLAGNEHLLFVTEPFRQRVAVVDRLSGAEIAELPSPPDGFKLPFSARTEGSNKLVILDSGQFPSPGSPAPPQLHVYSYVAEGGAFSAELERSIPVSVSIIFSEDVEVIGPSRYVVSDAGFGALWVIEPDGTVVAGVTPKTFDPLDAIPALGPCWFPPGAVVGGIPFRAQGDFAPGVGAMATDGTYLYMSGTCKGGVSRLPLSALSDARLPWERAADIEEVFTRPPGEVGQMKGLAVVQSRRGVPQLYALESFNLRLVRIDIGTGSRQVLFDNEVLFNFPVTAVLLPLPGAHELVVASDQEHRLKDLNAAITEDLVVPPFLLTKVIIKLAP
jgi:hypothetical protein